MFIKNTYFYLEVFICSILLNGISYFPCSSQKEPSFKLLNQGELQLISVSFNEASIWKELNEKSLLPQEIFQVFVARSASDINSTQPAIIGQYSLKDGSIVFKPTFPFRAGIEYLAVFIKQHSWSFQITEKPDYPLPEVTAVYPSSDTLPSNQLKIYLHFATPMSEGKSYQFIHLKNLEGDTLPQPFLELQPELWDENHQRLTLWFDPGRVKRALGPHEMSGSPLQEGNWYVLHLDQNWQDAQSHPLTGTITKRFYVGPPDRQKPSLDHWHLTLPKPNTLTPLEIHFGEAMDQALAMHTLSFVDQKGQKLQGQFKLVKGEHIAVFQPKNNWLKGSYNILAEAILEDMAGNNMNRLFDRDLNQSSTEVKPKDIYRLPFEIK